MQLFFIAQNGDKEAIEELYKRFSKLIKKLSKKVKYEEAETDIIIFFLKFIKKINLKKLENISQGEFVNYIYISLQNYTFNLIKKNSKKIYEYNIVANQIYYDSYAKLELIDTYNSMNKLSKMQKQIILYIYLYNYKVSELAKIFDVSRQAINQNKLKALKTLEKELLTKKD